MKSLTTHSLTPLSFLLILLSVKFRLVQAWEPTPTSLSPTPSPSPSPGNFTKWPHPKYDALEKLLYEGTRLDGLSLADSASGCKTRDGQPGRGNVAAEWVRFAFHDAATHNFEKGTGGVDASLFYELDRSENVGQGQKDTAAEFLHFAGKHISRADVVAIGTVLGVTSCGGLNTLPFRGGRIDAVIPGNPGVPETHTPIAETTETFRLMGFSPEEMIVLTACGHTLGGVRSVDFPDIVPSAPGSDEVVFQNFDTTPQFDLKVVTEFLDGTTQNPLVIHPNVTVRSDERIFNLDGGESMRTLRNATDRGFKIACKFGYIKMLDAVPKGLTLTQPIDLVPAKVVDAQLTIENRLLIFKVDLRLTQSLNTNPPSGRTVSLHWCDRRGLFENCRQYMNVAPFSASHKPKYSPVTEQAGFSFLQYSFRIPIDAQRSVSKYWFVVNENDGSAPVIHANNGTLYTLEQDTVFFVPRSSKVLPADSSELVVAVRSPLSPLAIPIPPPLQTPFVKTYEIAQSNTQLPRQRTHHLHWDPLRLPVQGYSFYAGRVQGKLDGMTVDAGVVLNGETFIDEYRSTIDVGGNTNIVNPTRDIKRVPAVVPGKP